MNDHVILAYGYSLIILLLSSFIFTLLYGTYNKGNEEEIATTKSTFGSLALGTIGLFIVLLAIGLFTMPP